MSEGKKKAFDEAEFMTLSRKQLAMSIAADRLNRERGLDDLKCLTGEGQWAEQIRLDREKENRPCITINQLPQFLRQVTGDIRAMNPAIHIGPGDDAASKDVAEIMEGKIRHIQYRSDAPSVYERAGESAAACGEGYFRILTDYDSPMSFDQEIKLSTIHNPHSVHFDPDARMSTREDAKWVIITESVPIEDFAEEYPDASAVSVEAMSDLEGAANWAHGENVIVAEKFWLEEKQVTIAQMPDGTIIQDPDKSTAAQALQTRKTEVCVCMWAKISGKEVLEGPNEFPSRYLPIIGVMGEELVIGSEVYRSSVIRFAKEPQRLYNYYSSADVEIVALQPKAPFLMTAKQVLGHENRFANANITNMAYLLYNVDPAAPPPSRVQPPVSSNGISAGIAKASADMRATTGIYDASLGHKGNETSGVAIRQRQMEADVSTSIYSDNVGKAVEHCGRILADMMPRVYDTTRKIQTVAKDGTEDLKMINQPVMQDGMTRVMNDFGTGRYDARVSVGPNYTTKRQEASEKMMEMGKAMPQIWGIAGDLMVKNMDIPGADQLADRMVKAMPPEMRPQSEQPDPAQMQQMQQQQMQQQQAAQMQQAMQQAQLAEQQAKTAQAEANAVKAQADAKRAQYETMMAELQTRSQANAVFAPQVGAFPAQPGMMP